MKKYVMVTAVAALALLVCAGNVLAKDANEPNVPKKPPVNKPIIVTGTISVTKDKNGTITEVKLTVNKNLMYLITLDKKGMELGQKMADKKVRATGTVESKGNVKWLTVEKYTEAVITPPVKPLSPK